MDSGASGPLVDSDMTDMVEGNPPHLEAWGRPHRLEAGEEVASEAAEGAETTDVVVDYGDSEWM